MKKLGLINLILLSDYSKIIVTGPPRAGTTISARIIAHELNYKFIDETMYDGNNAEKFGFLLWHRRKMVIQMTAFTRDIHNYYFNQNTAIVLIRRNIQDILDSMDNTIKFLETNIVCGDGLFRGFNRDARKVISKHFNLSEHEILPGGIYKHFEENMNKEKDYFELEYDCLKNHVLFIEKQTRRKEFKHIKQVDIDSEYFDKRGVLVL